MKFPFVTRRHHELVVQELKGELAETAFVLKGYRDGLADPNEWFSYLLLGVTFRGMDGDRLIELSPYDRDTYKGLPGVVDTLGQEGV